MKNPPRRSPARLRAEARRYLRRLNQRNKLKQKRRGQSGYQWKQKSKYATTIALAPKDIDIYRPRNYRRTARFIQKIRTAKGNKSRVKIDFRLTERISASAMLLLYAVVESVNSARTDTKIVTCNYPRDQKVESILQHVGFFGLVGKIGRGVEPPEDVRWWHKLSGHGRVDTEASEPIFKEISDTVIQIYGKKLYKGFSEAVNNCVEHAYIDAPSSEAGWWMFAGVREQRLSMVVCDLGVGIPNTIMEKNDLSTIETILRGLRLSRDKDSTLILAATVLHKSRTGKGHRGKGLKDILSITEKASVSTVSIYSNKGLRRFRKEGGGLKLEHHDYVNSINGTIIEWSVPLTDDIEPQKEAA